MGHATSHPKRNDTLKATDLGDEFLVYDREHDRVHVLNATVALGTPQGTTITNTAYYEHASSSDSSSAVFALPEYAFLPIVVK